MLARVTLAGMESKEKQGRTNYDWVNGMRVGILAGGIVGMLIGWLIGVNPLLMASSALPVPVFSVPGSPTAGN